MVCRYRRIRYDDVVLRSFSDPGFRQRNLSVENVTRGKYYSERGPALWPFGLVIDSLSIALAMQILRLLRTVAGFQKSAAVAAQPQIGIIDRGFTIGALS